MFFRQNFTITFLIAFLLGSPVLAQTEYQPNPNWEKNVQAAVQARDMEGAIFIINGEARAGTPLAMVFLADAFLKGHFGIQRDQEKATYWYNQALKKNSMDAVSHLGNLFFYGAPEVGIPANHEKAAEYMDIWAATGDPNAIAYQGILNVQGWGKDGSAQLGLERLKQSALTGNMVAILYLIEAHSKGKGLPKNKIEALAWAMVGSRVDDMAVTGFSKALRKEMSQAEIDAAYAKAQTIKLPDPWNKGE